jgi:hypothetical protein
MKLFSFVPNFKFPRVWVSLVKSLANGLYLETYPLYPYICRCNPFFLEFTNCASKLCFQIVFNGVVKGLGWRMSNQLNIQTQWHSLAPQLKIEIVSFHKTQQTQQNWLLPRKGYVIRYWSHSHYEGDDPPSPPHTLLQILFHTIGTWCVWPRPQGVGHSCEMGPTTVRW